MLQLEKALRSLALWISPDATDEIYRARQVSL